MGMPVAPGRGARVVDGNDAVAHTDAALWRVECRGAMRPPTPTPPTTGGPAPDAQAPTGTVPEPDAGNTPEPDASDTDG